MNLIIDIGNSSTKIAVFDGKEKIFSSRTRDFSCVKLMRKLVPYKIDKTIISTVRDTPEYIFDLLAVDIPLMHILTHKSKLPFRIEYDTPETLGTDRIAAVAGAYDQFHGDDVLIIDAGTAITYEFLSGDTYRGGNISPGIKMRFRALHKFTGKLPLVSAENKFSIPGQNTAEAIAAGVITGVTYEINEYIRTFEKKHTGFKVILTGGDSGYLKDKIDYKVTYMPDIVIDGLNYILEYNAK